VRATWEELERKKISGQGGEIERIFYRHLLSTKRPNNSSKSGGNPGITQNGKGGENVRHGRGGNIKRKGKGSSNEHLEKIRCRKEREGSNQAENRRTWGRPRGKLRQSKKESGSIPVEKKRLPFNRLGKGKRKNTRQRAAPKKNLTTWGKETS